VYLPLFLIFTDNGKLKQMSEVIWQKSPSPSGQPECICLMRALDRHFCPWRQAKNACSLQWVDTCAQKCLFPWRIRSPSDTYTAHPCAQHTDHATWDIYIDMPYMHCVQAMRPTTEYEYPFPIFTNNEKWKMDLCQRSRNVF